jgi:TonB family protein
MAKDYDEKQKDEKFDLLVVAQNQEKKSSRTFLMFLILSCCLHSPIGFLYFKHYQEVKGVSLAGVPDYMVAKLIQEKKPDVPEIKPEKKEEIEFKKDEDEKKIPEIQKPSEKKQKRPGDNRPKNAGGDVRSRVTKRGVLGMLSGRITGRRVGEEREGKKMVGGMEQVLRGIGDLAENVGAARFGTGGGIGFGKGFGSGFGGGLGSGGIDGLMSSRVGDATGDRNVKMKAKSFAQVKSPPPTVTSGNCRSANDIAKVVNSRGSRIKYCYDKGLRTDANLAGKITIRFKIDPAGNIESASVVSSSLKSPTVEDCVVSTIKQWKFNQVPGCNTVVNYPFNFSVS